MNATIFGGDLKKNISVSVPRLPKKANNNGKSSLEKVVAVSSPVQSGKTFVAVNLAVTVVQEGYKIALVDIDYKKFSVHTWLNCPPGEDGLQQALNDNSDP
ncbi:P-loop NTPase family protein, partial [Desulfotruncus alcoholivorax]|uniref:hypothetical protein n=1 Tax=Desulfotruncus alcoholivorax TaxID=265477 RepID=UPI00146F96E3